MEQKKEYQPRHFNSATSMLVSYPLTFESSIQPRPNPQFSFTVGSITQREKQQANPVENLKITPQVNREPLFDFTQSAPEFDTTSEANSGRTPSFLLRLIF